jgi:hypothetical protein
LKLFEDIEGALNHPRTAPMMLMVVHWIVAHPVRRS